MKDALITELSVDYPVRLICRVLRVCVSSYYRRQKLTISAREKQNTEITEKISAIFTEHRGRYGSPRVYRVLQKQGITCSRNRVTRLMRLAGLRVVPKKSFKPKTTIRAKKELYAPNRIKSVQIPELKPNEVWVGDITYLPKTNGGFYYLAAFMDLASRRIVGWDLQSSMPTELCLKALHRAIRSSEDCENLIVHTDRGCQYTSHLFREHLTNHGLIPSLSASGYCYDNAAMESFWSTLKREAFENTPCSDITQTSDLLFEYIELYYNKNRLHSSLGYLSPLDFEALTLNMKN